MTAINVTQPYTLFTETDGDPLENGYIYIGTEGLLPEDNPINVYWDEDFTIPAAQPIRTIGGYPSLNGRAGNLYVQTAYSIKVLDKKEQLIFYVQSSQGVVAQINETIAIYDTLAALDADPLIETGRRARTLGYYVAGDGGGNDYEIGTGFGADDGGSVIDLTASGLQAKGLFTDGLIRVNQFGGKADGTSFDNLALTVSAMAYLTSVGKKRLDWVYTGNVYEYSDKIPIPATDDNFAFFGSSRYVFLDFTSGTSDGIYFNGEHDNFTLQNIKITSSGSSTGIAFNSPNTGSATPLRDLLLRDFEIDGFKNGIAIAGGLNLKFEFGRVSGQGKAVAGGLGAEFGSALESINHVACDQVYWSSYETNIHNQATSSLSLKDCLSGFADTALKNDAGRICYLDNMYFDSNNDVAIYNDGYLIGSWLVSSLGTQTIINNSQRFKRTGHVQTNIRVYRSGTNQASIVTGTPTKIQFNAKTHDSESQFDEVTNYRFTATYPGYYDVHLMTRFRVGTVDKFYQAKIYVNGALYAEKLQQGPNAVVNQESIEVSAESIFLDVGDYVEGYVEHDEGVNSEIYFGSDTTYMSIVDS